MRRTGHVARMEEINGYIILIGNLKGGISLEDLGVDERITLQELMAHIAVRKISISVANVRVERPIPS